MISINPRKFPVISLLISILGMFLIFWQTFFLRKLPGDLLDGRFTVLVNDHWFKVVTLQTELTNLNFYYPFKNQLGFSDSFFATGIVSIPFRLIGLNSVNSWILSNMTLTITCLFFAYKFFQVELRSKLFSSLLVVLISTSYPFTAQVGHLQTIGYLIIFPIAFYAQKIFHSGKTKRFQNLCIVLILTQILALSAWYAFVFLILLCFAALLVAIVIMNPPTVFQNLKKHGILIFQDFKNMLPIARLSWAASIFPLAIIWILIYSKTAGYSQEKPFSGFVFYAPRWGDLFNSSTQAWGLQLKFNEFFQQSAGPTFERALGLTPFLLAIAIILPLIARFRGSNLNIQSNLKIKLSYYLTILFMVLIVVDEQGHSFWRFLWVAFPPIRSITVPFRIMIILTWILLFAIFMQLKNFKNKNKLVVLISIVILLDVGRPTISRWSESEFINPATTHMIDSLSMNKCDAFFINPSKDNAAPWLTQIDAMTLSSVSDIPTVNGYSGNWPQGWPITPYWGGATVEATTRWIAQSSPRSNLIFCYYDGVQATQAPLKVSIP
jgi:hypothetical protein